MDSRTSTIAGDGIEQVGAAVLLGGDRLTACLEALIELRQLASMLPGLVPEGTPGGAHLAVRGIAGRCRELASVVLQGLDDPSVTASLLSDAVFLDGPA